MGEAAAVPAVGAALHSGSGQEDWDLGWAVGTPAAAAQVADLEVRRQRAKVMLNSQATKHFCREYYNSYSKTQKSS